MFTVIKGGSQNSTFYAKWVSARDFYEHMNYVCPEFLFISERNKAIFLFLVAI